jgi:hypothetical protein
MAFFRSYIAPFLIVLTFLIAMVAVSARIFLPSDMMAPAPMEDTVGQGTAPTGPIAGRPEQQMVQVSWFLQGLPDDIS